MNYEEINALTVNGTIYILFDRLITDKSLVPENESWILYPEIVDPELSMYEQVNVYETLTKPTLQACEDELVIYKAELTADEDSRLAEIARKDDLVSRFLIIHSKDTGIPAFYNSASIIAITGDKANAKVYMRDLINDISRAVEAETLMIEIEAKDVELTTAQVIQQTKAARKELGMKARKICEEVLDVVAGWNISRELTSEQVNQMITNFAIANTHLKNFRPNSAKTAIQEIEIDGILVTQEMYDEVIEVFTINGL